MLAKVLGKRPLDFKSDDGKQICGTQIFVAYKDTNPKTQVEGELVDKVFVPHDSNVTIPLFKFGEEYDFVYDLVGFGSKARSVLKEILSKDGKKLPADPTNNGLPF